MGVVNYLSPEAQKEYRLKRLLERSAKNKKMPDPVKWIQGNFRLYDTGKLMSLFDCQERPLKLALSRDEKGNYKYTTIVWSWPKKSAKSSVIAAVCDYVAWNKPRSTITLIGNDLRQADSRVGHYIRENIKLGPRKDRINVNRSGYLINYPNGSLIEMVPIDPTGEAGGNQDLIVYSELWGWKSKAHQKMWTELTISPNKFGQSQRWIDTYSGHEGESIILEQLYEVGVNQGRKVWDDLEVYVNDAARILAVWATRPMFPWQSSDYYAEQEATLLPNEFLRIHRNQWVSGTDTFVPPEWWHSCRGNVPELKEKETIVLAMDAGVSDDSFALCGVRKWGADGVDVVYSRRWLPPQGGKISFTNPDNPNDRDTPEGEIRYLCEAYNVVMVAYDPYQLEDMANRLGREGVAWFFAFGQGAQRLTADSNLRTLIREKRLRHNGDPDLTEHVLNAGAKTDSEDSKIRIVKRATHLKVDLCVSLSMSAERCLYLNL